MEHAYTILHAPLTITGIQSLDGRVYTILEHSQNLHDLERRARAEVMRGRERIFDMLCVVAFILTTHALDVHNGWQLVSGLGTCVVAGVYMQVQIARIAFGRDD
jgi:hypothetical protein